MLSILYKDEVLGAGGGMVSGGGVVFGIVRSSVRENPDGAKGVIGGESKGVEGGATWARNQNTSFLSILLVNASSQQGLID
ncbi:hypothetical protein Tco_0014812 [Tanacetum coccineum]